MLILNDSLQYASLAHLASNYQIAAGWLTPIPGHPISGKSWIGSVSGQLLVSRPAPSGLPGQDKCVFGIRVGLSGTVGSVPFARIEFSGGTQLAINIETVSTNKHRFIVLSGDGTQIYVKSSPIDFSKPKYIEVDVSLAVQGKVAIRVDGLQDVIIESVNTSTWSSSNLWDRVRFFASGLVTLFADLYLMDGAESSSQIFSNPIGKTISRVAYPLKADSPESMGAWGLNRSSSKIKLCLFAGQSNINGRGLLPYPGVQPWRNPNPLIEIWENTTGTFAWRPLDAGVNTCDFFNTGLPPHYGPPGSPGSTPRRNFWGPEMMVAERMARLYENTGEFGPSPIKFIKCAKDASLSSIFPGSPGITWSPDQAGSLFFSFVEVINAAVTALGGWANIDTVDMFWDQGQSEGSFVQSLGGVYLGYFKRVVDALQAAIPKPIKWHRVRSQKKLNSLFFPFNDGIRGQQMSPELPGRWYNVDDVEIDSEFIHLTNRGYDDTGHILFEGWFRDALVLDRLKEYFFTGIPDEEYIAINAPNSRVASLQVAEFNLDLINNPVLGGTMKGHMRSSANNNQVVMSVGKVSSGPKSVSVSPTWQPVIGTSEGISTPEELTSKNIQIESL